MAPVQNYKIYFAHMVSHMHMLVVPALLPFLPSFFNTGFVELGYGMSLYMVVTLIFQVPFGYAVDRYGPKKMLGAGMALSGLAFISLGIFPNFIWFLVVMAIVGLVNTVYHPADYSLLSAQTPAEKLGRAFAVHTFSGNLGFAITPGVMFASVVIGGVPLAFIVAGALPLIGVYLLEPLQETIRAGKYFLFESWKTIQSQPSLRDETSGEAAAEKNGGQIRVRVNAQIIILTLFFTMTLLSSLPFQQFGATVFELEYGFSDAESAALVTVYLFANAFGILVGGVLADYSKHHGMIASLSFVIAFLLTVWVIVGGADASLWLLVVVLALIGAAIGAISPSRDLMVKKLAPAGSEGKVFGMVSTGFHIAGAVGPLYLTWFLDNGEMRWVFIAAAIAMGVSIVIALYQEGRILQKAKREALAKTVFS